MKTGELVSIHKEVVEKEEKSLCKRPTLEVWDCPFFFFEREIREKKKEN